MALLLFIYVVMAFLMVALSIPLIQRRVPPNWLYGFRTPKTLKHPDIWYPANAYAGKWLLGMGIFGGMVSGITYLLPGLSEDDFAMLTTFALLAYTAVMMIQLFRYLRRFP